MKVKFVNLSGAKYCNLVENVKFTPWTHLKIIPRRLKTVNRVWAN